MNKSLEYIPGIDFLRAISVLLVFLFHLEIQFFKSGYLGVDIFFVISGFLITRILIQEYDNSGKIDFFNFYKRRILRLYPAFLSTIFFTVLVSLFLFTENLMAKTLETAAFSSIYLSNFYLWLNSGYFSKIAVDNSLLHTWSLSIEEQFYLFWPLLVLFLLKLNRAKMKYWLSFLFLLFFSFNLLSLFDNQTLFTVFGSQILSLLNNKGFDIFFYLTPFRGFELIAGAISFFIWKERKQEYLSLLVPIGCIFTSSGLIIGHYFHGGSLFPALCVVIGSSIILISFKSKKLVSEYLFLNLFRELGKMSYSIYLIHLPIIVFYKYLKFTPLDLWDYFLLTGGVIILALLQYRLIEIPYRLKRDSFKNSSVISSFFISSILIFCLFLYFSKKKEFFPKKSYQIPSSSWIEEEACLIGKKAADCLPIKSRSERNTVFLLGDSMITNLYPGLKQATGSNGIELRFSASDWDILNHFFEPEGMTPVLSVILPTLARGDKFIVSFASWRFWKNKKEFYKDHSLFKQANMKGEFDIDKLRHFESNTLTLSKALRSRGVEFFYVKDFPSWMNQREFNACVDKRLSLKECEVNLEKLPKKQIAIYESLKSNLGSSFINVDYLICPQSRCRLNSNGIFISRDSDPHLGFEFSQQFYKDFLKIFFD